MLLRVRLISRPPSPSAQKLLALYGCVPFVGASWARSEDETHPGLGLGYIRRTWALPLRKVMLMGFVWRRGRQTNPITLPPPAQGDANDYRMHPLG